MLPNEREEREYGDHAERWYCFLNNSLITYDVAVPVG